MIAETSIDVVKIINDGGIVGLFIVILFGGLRQWWVWGWAYRAQKEELTEWRRLALQGTSLARESLETIQQAKDRGAFQ